jgi:hypothetical protein
MAECARESRSLKRKRAAARFNRGSNDQSTWSMSLSRASSTAADPPASSREAGTTNDRQSIGSDRRQLSRSTDSSQTGSGNARGLARARSGTEAMRSRSSSINLRATEREACPVNEWEGEGLPPSKGWKGRLLPPLREFFKNNLPVLIYLGSAYMQAID